MNNLTVKTIKPNNYSSRIIKLLQQLNPDKDSDKIAQLLDQMSRLGNYTCFGLFQHDKIIGVSSGWTSVRIYCGKQLELDNVVIDATLQSNGYGKLFLEKIEEWALQEDYQSISLNTYLSNSRSHKFYFNHGFKILGFHFEKLIK